MRGAKEKGKGSSKATRILYASPHVCVCVSACGRACCAAFFSLVPNGWRVAVTWLMAHGSWLVASIILQSQSRARPSPPSVTVRYPSPALRCAIELASCCYLVVVLGCVWWHWHIVVSRPVSVVDVSAQTLASGSRGWATEIRQWRMYAFLCHTCHLDVQMCEALKSPVLFITHSVCVHAAAEQDARWPISAPFFPSSFLRTCSLSTKEANKVTTRFRTRV